MDVGHSANSTGSHMAMLEHRKHTYAEPLSIKMNQLPALWDTLKSDNFNDNQLPVISIKNSAQKLLNTHSQHLVHQNTQKYKD
jgi:hypothetical protein